MNHKQVTGIFILILAVSISVFSQKSEKAISNPVKSSPAFAELLLQKTLLQVDLEDLTVRFTDEYPKVKELRIEIALIDRTLADIVNLRDSDAPKLTLALGKMFVKKISLQTDLKMLQEKYDEKHPEVVRAKRKVAIFQTAIAKIME